MKKTSKLFTENLDRHLRGIALVGWGARVILAKELGIHRRTIDAWYQNPDRAPRADVLTRLVEFINNRRKKLANLSPISANDLLPWK